MKVKQLFQSPRTRVWSGVLLGIGLFICLGIILMHQSPTPYPAYRTESPSPSGVKAFYTLLKKNYAQVESWSKPAQALPFLASRQLMIMVEPSVPLNSEEIEQWTRWLAAGNQLWLLDRNPKGLFHLQTSLLSPETNAAASSTPPPPATITGSEEWKGTYHATLESDARLIAAANDQVLLRDKLGVIALSRAYGQGELMVLLAPEWLTNGLILEQDNLQLVLPFILRADPKVIWFNDFIHRNNHLPTALGGYPQWLLVLLAQGFISCLLWLWYKGKRFGPIRTPREWVVRFGDERIRAVASWYERGKLYQASLAIQTEFLRHALPEKWGIPANLEDPEFIEAALRRMPPAKQKQWLPTWRELRKNGSHKISQKIYLQWSQLLDDLQKEVEHR